MSEGQGKMPRGALVVLEGADRGDKTAFVGRLVDALNNRGIPAKRGKFPDYTTRYGSAIQNARYSPNSLSPEVLVQLYSANRWESEPKIKATLLAGKTLVLDRYAASGAAYGAENAKKDLSWCKEWDRGLPSPDFVALLTLGENPPNERGETVQNITNNFELLREETWKTIDINKTTEEVHEELLSEVLKVIERVKNQPINRLYE